MVGSKLFKIFAKTIEGRDRDTHLKMFKAKKALTDAELAEVIGVTQVQINRIVNRKSATSKETANVICEYFSVDFDTLFEIVPSYTSQEV